jgi:hypothetical protein
MVRRRLCGDNLRDSVWRARKSSTFAASQDHRRAPQNMQISVSIQVVTAFAQILDYMKPSQYGPRGLEGAATRIIMAREWHDDGQ